MNPSKQIKLGAVVSYIAIAINIISGLLFTPWMIRCIGQQDYGLYTLAMSVIGLFVFDFGLSTAITRFIAKYLAESRQDKADNCLGLAFRLYFLIDILLLFILVGVYFFLPVIYKELTPDELSKFKIIYVIASVFSVLSFPFIPQNGVLSAHEKFVQLKLCDVIHKVLIVGLMSLCLVQGYGLSALVLVNAFAGIFVILLKIWIIKHKTHQSLNVKYFNLQEFKELLGYSWWVTVMAIAQRFIFNLAPSVLGYFSGSTSIAILGIAMTVEGYTYTFANAINGMFLPKVTRILTYNPDELLPLMIRVGRIQIIIIGAIVLGFCCLGKEFVHLWVGEEFSTSYLCALLIIIPSFFQLPQEIGTQAIYALNKVRSLAVVFVIMALVNIVLSLILAKSMGAIGICLSVFIAYMVRTIGMDYIFFKDMKIDIFSFFKDAYGPMCAPMLLILVIGLLINYIIPFEPSWLTFAIKCCAFVFVYVGIIWFGAMNNIERKLFIDPMIKILNRIK